MRAEEFVQAGIVSEFPKVARSHPISFAIRRVGLVGMIGVKAKSTRVFSKALFERGGANAPIQDGNRQWCTIAPTICGDGTKLPTCLIFQGMNGAIWSNWVMDIPAEAEDVHVSSSPNGWTNIQLGMT